MKIHQFEDKGLAHYSYAILCEHEQKLILIDPARNPEPYYDYAAEHEAQIIGIIETHPHADFVSSHLEIHQTTGAAIYTHSQVKPEFPFISLDEGGALDVGKIKLIALHTPGHSPDSISILLKHDGIDKVVFTGDTLFVGDVGRPDLREEDKGGKAQKKELARQMYNSTRNKLMKLADDVVVYPAHGAGTLCGKGLSDANSSTIGQEKASNPALQPMTKNEFVEMILDDQPFIPKYFGYNVALNKKGAPAYQASVEAVPRLEGTFQPDLNIFVIDGRPENVFKKGHWPGAINIQEGLKFETWLGSILAPGELFYLVAETQDILDSLISKAAKIGYEVFIKGAVVQPTFIGTPSDVLDLVDFKSDPTSYTVVDIRNATEVEKNPIFGHAISVPLPELRERAQEIPTDKPVVVHCAGGYRSAAGSSILAAALPHVPVLDLGEAVHEFEPADQSQSS